MEAYKVRIQIARDTDFFTTVTTDRQTDSQTAKKKVNIKVIV